MFKKILLLGMAVAALAAFIAPAMANAATQLTNENGETLPVGTTVTATSENTVTEAEGNVLTCEEVDLHGTVEVNNGTTVKIVDHEGSTTSGCEFDGFLPVEIDPTLTELHIGPSTPGTAVFSFTVTTLGCTATSGASSVVGGASSNSLVVSAAVTGTCGNGNLNGEYELFAGGKPVTIDM